MPEYGPALVQFSLWKTGSTSTRNLLREHAGTRRKCGQHDPVAKHPDMRNGRLVTGTVRNPLTHRCSVYAHWANTAGGQAWREAHGVDGIDAFREWTRWTLARRTWDRVGWIAQAGDADDYAASGLGYTSWCVAYLYTDREDWQGPPTLDAPFGVDVLVATDRLLEGWGLLLGLDLDDPPANTRRQRGVEHWTGPDDYRDWYTPDLLDAVREQDAPMFRLMGWDGFGGAAHAVRWVRGQTMAEA